MAAGPKMRAAWLWGTSLVIAIFILILRVRASPEASSVVLGLVLGVVLILVIIVVVGSFYSLPVAQARKAAPSAWVHFCEDLRAPLRRRVLRVDEVGVWVLDAHGKAVDRWPYESIDSARIAPVRPPGAAIDRRGLQITVDGWTVSFLLYGKFQVRTPLEPLQQATALIEARIQHATPT